MHLGFGLNFSDLYNVEKVHQAFINFLKNYYQNEVNKNHETNITHSLYIASPNAQDFYNYYNSLKENLIQKALIAEQFLVELFSIKEDFLKYQEAFSKLALIHKCKREFIERIVLKKADNNICLNSLEHTQEKLYTALTVASALAFGSEDEKNGVEEKAIKSDFSQKGIISSFFQSPFFEGLYAEKVLFWLQDREKYKLELASAIEYALNILTAPYAESALFKIPKKLDYDNLLTLQRRQEKSSEIAILEQSAYHSRETFDLTDKGLNLAQALDQSNYCLICHERAKDSCRKGLYSSSGLFKDLPKKEILVLSDDKKDLEIKMDPIFKEHKIFKLSPTNVPLKGCPLDEKISEMNFLYSKGNVIAALVMLTLDNPLCAATGHRICNDCMKSCIYQKQEPVNIPGVETNILDIVLSFTYGFEIYSLLTKWNPLNIKYIKDDQINDKINAKVKKDLSYQTSFKILISGLGPSGFTLAHYLLNEGHTVVAVDGSKIEPLSPEISGVMPDGSRREFLPIKDVNILYENLSERLVAGFGGVMEYGITTRWNKNYLKLIRIILERRNNFHMFGGIRFGSNINFNDLQALGFDHVALSLGSGSPNIPKIKNLLCRGVRFASDFLMLMQLGGAFKRDSLTNLQLRMPIIIIGAGLTAVDTATESLAYYKLQVEKFLTTYEFLLAHYSEIIRSNEEEPELLAKKLIEETWIEEERIMAQEFISHAQGLRKTKNSTKFLKALGGVKILYRKSLQDCPAYRLNHEELNSAFKEGIEFIENIEPTEIIADEYGAASGVKCLYREKTITLPAKSVLIATGTGKNKILAEEYKTDFEKLENISIFGDLDSEYAGSVVSAMASAKNKYKLITAKLQERREERQLMLKLKNIEKNAEDIENIERLTNRNSAFTSMINEKLRAKVLEVKKISEKIFEIIIYSPIAAKNFSPGQFYKLQAFETTFETDFSGSFINKATASISMEPIALTGSLVDKEKGIISTIVLEGGVSTYLTKFLKPGQFITLMGPTGTPTEIPIKENIMLVGGGLGNAVLFSIAQAMKEKGCNIIYFAAYRKAEDRFKMHEIEKSADIVVWVCEEEELNINRSQDLSVKGNIIEAILSYKEIIKQRRNKTSFKIFLELENIDRILTIGSDGMMHAVQKLVMGPLKKYLKPNIKAFASINSPMQCMMKGICAQCIQKNIVNEKEEYIYSCKNQDQDLSSVDFAFLNQRLKQNSLWEKLNYLYVKLLAHH